jgi:transcription antitermination factor NusA-like protein
MIKSFFSYLESVNYEDYTKSLSEQEFFEIYEKECYEFDLKNPILQRGIKRNEDFIYINTDKHYTLTKELDQYNIDVVKYEKESLPMIVAAINKSNLGMVPNNDGTVIRLKVP